MKKSFKYRIYANTETIQKAEKWLDLLRQLYNNCLSERIMAYRENKESVSVYTQMRKLPHIKKEFPEYRQISSQTLQDVLQRLDRAYQNFFLRVKNGSKKAGFPRFKGHHRYDSFTLKQAGYKLNGKYLLLKNIGKFKIKLSRPAEGTIKTITVSRTSCSKWFVCFSCDRVPLKLLLKTNKEIGIDMGCKSFLTDSSGNKVKNPRFFKKSQRLLIKRAQKLSHKKKSSNRRNKARILVAKAYERIFNQRKDFHFKVANRLLKENDIVYIEKLKYFKTFRNLNRSMRDAAWFDFFNILKAKAEEAGRKVIEAPARSTSQICSSCGTVVPKDLSVRVHNCSFCGLIIDRDYNSALNILRLGQGLRGAETKVSAMN
ncbi:MAG: transposase [Actinobacteria bacterium]|nr:transposase [Actinomycetota bacterium]